jgi:molybdopterin converting factor small subunit
MRLRVKLMGMLKQRTPPGGVLELDCQPATIRRALEALGIPGAGAHVFSVNGALQKDPDHPLQDGDELTVLPPVGGG